MARALQFSGLTMKNERLPALWGRVNAETLAAATGAHLTTARRWKRLSVLPAWLARFVRVIVEGHLEDIAAAWSGWRIVAGELVSPEGWAVSPGEIRALPFLRQQLTHYRAQARLPAQADMLTGVWSTLPGALAYDAAPRPGAAVVDLRAVVARSTAEAPQQQRGREQHPGEPDHRVRG